MGLCFRCTNGTLGQWLDSYPPVVVTAAMAALVIWKHRGNIARLRRGEEPRVDGDARRGSYAGE